MTTDQGMEYKKTKDKFMPKLMIAQKHITVMPIIPAHPSTENCFSENILRLLLYKLYQSDGC